ncbi:MAG TPA: class I tRNA ligase family protein [Chitinophagaceae bacterium]|nr:class I tRNA ligase family protein [Chitinophagaceae bacterium]
MEYNFRAIEKKWQQRWKESGAYKVENDFTKPKCYVLDMFPYPSGAGLHVGHPLGYIASDIFARYKRLKGFNVLHPMGYDSFGLPAEQYALETGQHPAVTTENNIKNFRQQLDNIGFSFDWSREVRTSDPEYYRWTQWIFLRLFNSWYDVRQNKARGIDELVRTFEKEGNASANGYTQTKKIFTAGEWKSFSEAEKMEALMEYRLAYAAYGEVNWCEALGTVLANDEVINGVSERGGYPVIKKKMRQWYLRITAYADRLLQGLGTVDFSDAMKEMQRNWIGKSQGAEITFAIDNSPLTLDVYTTRPDTIFGVDFMVLAPEHELVEKITTPEQRARIDEYLKYVKSRSERERLAEVKQVTGEFTGAYAINPFNGRRIPVWIAEYVLAGYGTGAIMAVPCGDQRDYDFATHFNISITNIIGDYYNGKEANPTKEATLINSGFLNGMKMTDAFDVVLKKIEEAGIGKRKVNYKMRDAGFSRQRYWGEPFPVVYHNGIAYPLSDEELPVTLPYVEHYKPGPEGEGPLANVTDWVNVNADEIELGDTYLNLTPASPADGIYKRETNTMPGYAGSSWYFLRYMDPHNNKEFADRKATDYWNQVDIYVGGTEHAVGHLLYSRMWTKVLFDLNLIGFDEPYKKLINQGMIQGNSRFVYRLNILGSLRNDPTNKIVRNNVFVSYGIYKRILEEGTLIQSITPYLVANNLFGNIVLSIHDKISDHFNGIHIDVNIVDGTELNIGLFRKLKQEYADAFLILEDDSILSPGQDLSETSSKYICGAEIEKMSKSKYNVVNPNDLIDKYGADTFRMYEMFLGPVEASKPWDTKGIEGVHRFLKKLWRLFFDEEKGKIWNTDTATDAELKILHKAIKKIEDDTERFSYNTAVSAFMVCVNELSDAKCHKKEILEPLLILLAPYAPHIAEELYHQVNSFSAGEASILTASYPELEEKYLAETEKEYPVSVNGRLRTTIKISLDASQSDVEKIALGNEVIQKWMEGKQPKKIIFVKNKMINVVV